MVRVLPRFSRIKGWLRFGQRASIKADQQAAQRLRDDAEGGTALPPIGSSNSLSRSGGKGSGQAAGTTSGCSSRRPPRRSQSQCSNLSFASNGYDEALADSPENSRKVPGAMPMRKFNLATGSRFTFHPHARSVQRWNLLVAALLFVQAIILPVQIAFVPDEEFVNHPYMMWLNCWVDLVFWLDVLLRFFVQVQSRDSSYWVMDVCNIARIYFQSSFIVDVCSVLPLKRLSRELAAQVTLSIKGIVMKQLCGKMVSFHQLLRFARVPRVWRDLRSENSVINSSMQFTYVQSALLTSSLTILFTMHVMACVWASMAVKKPSGGDTTWYDYYAAGKPYEELYSLSSGDFTFVYVSSLYWAVFTLTGIGYGDVVPISPCEYAVAILCMFVGAITWAWIVASIVSIMATMNQADNEHSQVVDCINEILQDCNASVTLARRLREYFTKRRDVRQREFIGNLIERLSPELRIEVVYVVHQQLIDSVWWLQQIPIKCKFMVDLTQAMKAVLVPPNDLLPNRHELCYIWKGLCIHGGQILSRGKVFGLDMLLNNEALRKPFDTLSLTFLHLLVLTKSSLNDVLHIHPEIQPFIRKAFVTFVVIRGLLFKANQLRRQRSRISAGSGSSTQARPSRQMSLMEVTFNRRLSSKPTGSLEDLGNGHDHCSTLDEDNPANSGTGRLKRRSSSAGSAVAYSSEGHTHRGGVTVSDVSRLMERVDATEARLTVRVSSLEAAARRLEQQVKLLKSM